MTIKTSPHYISGQTSLQSESSMPFSGTIFLLHAFDVGDAIDLIRLKEDHFPNAINHPWEKHFRHYHIPLTIENSLANHPQKVECIRSNVHHFGAISLIYKVPFTGSLERLRNTIHDLTRDYQRHSLEDVQKIFEKIEPYTSQAKCFHHRTSYIIAHVNPLPEAIISSQTLVETHGALIASALRFETSTISEFQIHDILLSTTGYYQNDLVIIDTEAAFVYDEEADELLDFFEQALVQRLELQYFDKLLDAKLDVVYNQTLRPKSLFAYLPFIGTVYDPLGELSKLKVDISVITERLNNSIKLANEPYYSKVYELLTNKFEFQMWQDSIEKKLSIVRDVLSIYQSKINVIREDMLSVLVIILIAIELIVALIK